ncbi:MAG: CSLREA domain-containing protein [Thermoflexales bacterium]|nr:CSLREA domain-containing protein [Thermoflexales bacterium]
MYLSKVDYTPGGGLPHGDVVGQWLDEAGEVVGEPFVIADATGAEQFYWPYVSYNPYNQRFLVSMRRTGMTSRFSRHTFSLSVAALGAGLGLALTILLVLGAAPPLVCAAEIDGIDTTDDDLAKNNNCTLREAIQAANTDAKVDRCPAGSGADTILLPAGIYTLTLAGAGEDSNATGDLDITAPLTIAGVGPGQTIINPGAGTVVISGVTIMDGHVISSSGGGIYNAGAALTLNHTIVTSNTAHGDWPEGRGGGIYNAGPELALIGATIVSSNVATGTHSGGGGVSVDRGNALLSEGQIIGNFATWGGGVFVDTGYIVLSGTQAYIAGNSTTASGGGIYAYHGSVTLNSTQVQITGNLAGGSGGGVVLDGGDASLNVVEGQIAGNSARSEGGGILSGGKIVLSGGQIVDNAAGLRGGGMALHWGHLTLSSTQTHIAGNSAPEGSGLYSYGGMIDQLAALTIGGDVYQVGEVFNGGDAALRIDGSLHLKVGVFNAPSMLEITGLFTHTGGTYRQMQVVSGMADVGFPKVGGLILNAGGRDLGRTEVVIRAGQDCTTVGGETVRHCYTITSTTPATVTATFFFNSSELPAGNTCDTLDLYHWDGAWSAPLAADGRQCVSSPYSVRVTDVASFSPFVLKSGGAPTIVALRALVARGGAPALLLLGAFALGLVGAALRRGWWR